MNTIFASIKNALGSQPQSVFDLKIAQSKTRAVESNFAEKVAWLYEASEANPTQGVSLETARSRADSISANPTTDCLFFHQFIALHQTPHHTRSSSLAHNEQVTQVNHFLSEFRPDAVNVTDLVS